MNCVYELVAYYLDLPDFMYTTHPVFYISRLMKYCTNGRCQPPPPFVELKGYLIEYEVEKILDKKYTKCYGVDCSILGTPPIGWERPTQEAQMRSGSKTRNYYIIQDNIQICNPVYPPLRV